MDYSEFLKHKADRFKSSHFGIAEEANIHELLFPFQASIVRWALRKGRAAIFSGCGTGKTLMQCEWARIVHEAAGQDVLIVAPLAVSRQTVEEAKKIGVNVAYCRTSADVRVGINITNYERLDRLDASRFGAVVLDESSIIKSFNGKTKQRIFEIFRDTPFKLCCTATPSPNDHMEILNHAEFLGAMKSNEALAIWFINDSMSMGTYRLKKHAVRDFWRWVASWAVALQKPSDIGFSDDGFVLPSLNVIEHVLPVDLTINSGDMLFRSPEISATSIHSEKRLTAQARAEQAVQIAMAAEKPVCIWCDTNYEADFIKKSLPDAVEVRGCDTPERKEQAAFDFACGLIPVFVSKPSIFGFGMNLQICHNVIFAGISYSYESYYQAVRRFWRFGQTHAVNVHIVMGETEKTIMETIRRKEKAFMEMGENMQKEMTEFNEISCSKEYKLDYVSQIDRRAAHDLILGDCVVEARKIKSESVGFSIFSPPFSGLYIYSDSFRDMGNTRSDKEFFEGIGHLLPELLRITIPGRLCAIHCKNLVDYKVRDGRAGLRDFRGDIIRAMETSGWKYHSEVCIWKDPVTEMQRTKAQGLLHKQAKMDSSLLRQGLPDYLVVFRKWPENGDTSGPLPIKRPKGFESYVGEDCPKQNQLSAEYYSIHVWQRYASPVWWDIRQMNVLNGKRACSDKDERHICPLQLDVIERAIHLWTNEGDTVFSPFAGIGSEGYCAVKMGRKFIGVELKPEYWQQAIKNLESAYQEKETLF